MALRVQAGMMLENKFIDLSLNLDTVEFCLTLDQEELLTPSGHLISSENSDLLYHILAEMRCQKQLSAQISTLLLHCLATEKLDQLEELTDEEILKQKLLSDLVIAPSADSLVAKTQKKEWRALHAYFMSNEISLPDFKQAEENDSRYLSMNESERKNFDKLVKLVSKDICGFNSAQKAVVCAAQDHHGSLIYGFFLALSLISPLEYATAIAAARELFPWCNSGIELVKYENIIHELSLSAQTMKTYLSLQDRTSLMSYRK